MKTQFNNTKEQQNSAPVKVMNESFTPGTPKLKDNRPSAVIQRQLRETMYDSSGGEVITNKIENKTGLPLNLKSGMEKLSGYSMDDVRVHYNSNKPAQLKAHAYAKGSNIYLAPGQKRHLAHELGHVVQQKRNEVVPTFQLKGKVNINDDPKLEKDADRLGERALQIGNIGEIPRQHLEINQGNQSPVVQGFFYSKTDSSQPQDRNYDVQIFSTQQEIVGKLSQDLRILGVDYPLVSLQRLVELLLEDIKARKAHWENRAKNGILISDIVQILQHKIVHYSETGLRNLVRDIFKSLHQKRQTQQPINRFDMQGFLDGAPTATGAGRAVQVPAGLGPNVRQPSQEQFLYEYIQQMENPNAIIFENRDLTQVNFSNLTDLDFEHITFKNVVFSGPFTNVPFQKVDFQECTFQNANFINTSFNNATLSNIEFTDVTFDPQTSFKNARISPLTMQYLTTIVTLNRANHNISSITGYRTQINLEEINVSGYEPTNYLANMTGIVESKRILARRSLRGSNFANANLENADLSQTNLSYSNFKDANLKGANLSNANLVDINLIDAIIEDANLTGIQADVSTFKQLVRLGITDFSQMKLDLSGADLSGLNLSRMNLSGAFLIRCNLSNVNLSNAILSNTMLIGANFAGANVHNLRVDGAKMDGIATRGLLNAGLLSFFNADLRNANLLGLDFSNRMLNNADLRGANLSNLVLNNALLDGVKLDRLAFYTLYSSGHRNFYTYDFSNSDFSRLNMTGSILASANLTNTNFFQSNLTNADFTRAFLVGADFTNAILTNTSFRGATMDERVFKRLWSAGIRDFSDVILHGANLSNKNLSGANFNGASLIGTNFSSANLSRANLSQANLTNTSFTGSNLSNAIFRRNILANNNFINVVNFNGTNIDSSVFDDLLSNGYRDFSSMNVDLTGYNLEGKNLNDVNLTGANLTNAILAGASFNRTNLTGVNITGARLRGVDLRTAIMDTATLQVARRRGAYTRPIIRVGGHNLGRRN
ncbi:MAG: pentapeptide repeat-containing protein [Bacteroidales bacterium]|nr:pentapeptide repeat-containing protein [Bacteroidales bacterium]